MGKGALLPLRNIKRMQDFIKKTRYSSNGCIEWCGYRREYGYGVLRINGVAYLTHRLSYAWANSVNLMAEQFICHACDNPACVNPDHLWLGDNRANIDDALTKGRMSVFKGHTMNIGERNGRCKLSIENVNTIREHLKEGISQQRIAQRFGISQKTVSQIKRGSIWNHDN